MIDGGIWHQPKTETGRKLLGLWRFEWKVQRIRKSLDPTVRESTRWYNGFVTCHYHLYLRLLSVGVVFLVYTTDVFRLSGPGECLVSVRRQFDPSTGLTSFPDSVLQSRIRFTDQCLFSSLVTLRTRTPEECVNDIPNLSQDLGPVDPSVGPTSPLTTLVSLHPGCEKDSGIRSDGS